MTTTVRLMTHTPDQSRSSCHELYWFVSRTAWWPVSRFEEDLRDVVVQDDATEQGGERVPLRGAECGRQLLDPPAGLDVELLGHPAALRGQCDAHRPHVLRIGLAPDQAVALGAVHEAGEARLGQAEGR